jgi:hypothetical protein
MNTNAESTALPLLPINYHVKSAKKNIKNTKEYKKITLNMLIPPHETTTIQRNCNSTR